MAHNDPPEDQEDPADIFDSSLSTLFDIPPFALSPAKNGFVSYTSPDRLSTFQLRLPSPPPNLHRALQANHLWLSGIYLADLISSGEIFLQGKRVAELGAGAGLPGLIACRTGADVVSTDWGVSEMLEVLRQNFATNVRGVDGTGRWVVEGHQWGTDPGNVLSALGVNGQDGRFDALLLADTLWVSDAHSALLDSISALLRPSGTAYVAAGLHTGRGPINRFTASATSRGFCVEHIRNVRWKAGGGWDDCDVEEGVLEEERGVVVYMKLTRTTVVS